ncbi:hypothetical protein J8273_8554 [Carpediemonas membranifera]|uniref:Tyr recombinase domain-containing protein n=1 Tax=Carpediemonas membranifera TaxID=201153 RepID=A0A8J6BU14_9EUKA|nr:hypothetical protein J8273_8554 [Carpediemonas membranifera]|eukprot:KAG9389871.1 hypothetical protein J8273_8554 [Carpediemonas membranifera]
MKAREHESWSAPFRNVAVALLLSFVGSRANEANIVQVGSNGVEYEPFQFTESQLESDQGKELVRYCQARKVKQAEWDKKGTGRTADKRLILFPKVDGRIMQRRSWAKLVSDATKEVQPGVTSHAFRRSVTDAEHQLTGRLSPVMRRLGQSTMEAARRYIGRSGSGGTSPGEPESPRPASGLPDGSAPTTPLNRSPRLETIPPTRRLLMTLTAEPTTQSHNVVKSLNWN